jgi:hypothetical protein
LAKYYIDLNAFLIVNLCHQVLSNKMLTGLAGPEACLLKQNSVPELVNPDLS